MTWGYEKLDENGKVKYVPMNDFDGSVTGHVVYNVKAWMDENPEEARRLGWIKHIHYSVKEIREKWPHTQSQYLVKYPKQVDAFTIEDNYHVMDKSEEQMLLEELLQYTSWGEDGGITFYGFDDN